MDRNFSEIAHQYALDVLSGEVLAGKYTRLACRRYLNEREAEQRGDFPYVWSDEHAADVCTFIEQLPHVEGTWKTKTITLEPAQVFILGNVFGWRRSDDRAKRRFTSAYIEVARKNAKSTLAAGVALYCLAHEQTSGPQVRVAATTGDQARIVFGIANRMVRRLPKRLRNDWDLEARANDIVYRPIAHGQELDYGDIKPINAKASTQDGLNPSCTVTDELHAWERRGLWDILRSAKGARPDSLTFAITTAGQNLDGVCYEQRNIVVDVLEGRFIEGEHYFGIIYTIDENDDHFDESVWPKANPLWGVSVQPEEMRQYAAEAKQSPDSEGEFKTKRLNMWLHAASPWLSMAHWQMCTNEGLEPAAFAGAEAWIGADLASRDDIAALALVIPQGNLLNVFTRHYLPEELVKALAKERPAYNTWSQQGYLELTPGDWIDHRVIEAQIREWCRQYTVHNIVFDQYGGAQQMAANLVDDGYQAEILAKNARNYSTAALDFEARVKTLRIRHDGDPLLAWQVSNCVVTKGVDGSILPKKRDKNSKGKIDAIDAILGAWSKALERTERYASTEVLM